MAYLIVKGGEQAYSWFRLGNDPIEIGRSAEREICVPDQTISNLHAVITREAKGYKLRDLGSTNGTFVNNDKIGQVYLTDGDICRIGGTAFVFVDETDAFDAFSPSASGATEIPEDEQTGAFEDPASQTVTLSLDEIEIDLLRPNPPAAEGVYDNELVRRQQNQIAVLYRLGQVAHEVDSVYEFLPKLAQLVHEAMDGDRVFVMTRDDSSDELVPRAYAGNSSGEDQVVSSTVLRHALDEVTAVLSHDALVDPRFRGGESVSTLGIRSVMCVPMRSASKIMGLIYVDTLSRISAFSEDTLRCLGIVANQAAMTLHNIRLFEQQIQTNEQLQAAKTRIQAWNRELERKVEERTQEIRAQAEEITQLSELKDQLLGTAAHDLRTPITVIRGYAQLVGMSIQGGMLEEDRLLEDIGVVERTAVEMSTLLDDLLDVSKIEAGKISIMPQPTDPSEIAASCYHLHELWGRTKGIGVRLEVPPELPLVFCDGKRISQVLNNLISNAVKFSHEGDEVVLKLQIEEHGVVFVVEDTGQGIKGEDMPKLFGRFEQTSTKSTASEKGAGLGLAIAKKLIEMHGSCIDVSSEAGAGSRFSFVLPFDASEGNSASPQGQEATKLDVG